MTAIRSKQQEIEAAWKEVEKKKPRPVLNLAVQIRPFRADLPEWKRGKLKHGANDRDKSLSDRVACAEELGWLVEQVSDTVYHVMTHSFQEFDIYDV